MLAAADPTVALTGGPALCPNPHRYLNELGSGAFGNVVLAQDTHTLELVAVKKLPRLPDDRLQLERELLVHSRLRHPHVVRFHEVFLSPNHYNLVLEYVPGEWTGMAQASGRACSWLYLGLRPHPSVPWRGSCMEDDSCPDLSAAHPP